MGSSVVRLGINKARDSWRGSARCSTVMSSQVWQRMARVLRFDMAGYGPARLFGVRVSRYGMVGLSSVWLGTAI